MKNKFFAKPIALLLALTLTLSMGVTTVFAETDGTVSDITITSPSDELASEGGLVEFTVEVDATPATTQAIYVAAANDAGQFVDPVTVIIASPAVTTSGAITINTQNLSTTATVAWTLYASTGTLTSSNLSGAVTSAILAQATSAVTGGPGGGEEEDPPADDQLIEFTVKLNNNASTMANSATGITVDVTIPTQGADYTLYAKAEATGVPAATAANPMASTATTTNFSLTIPKNLSKDTVRTWAVRVTTKPNYEGGITKNITQEKAPDVIYASEAQIESIYVGSAITASGGSKQLLITLVKAASEGVAFSGIATSGGATPATVSISGAVPENRKSASINVSFPTSANPTWTYFIRLASSGNSKTGTLTTAPPAQQPVTPQTPSYTGSSPSSSSSGGGGGGGGYTPSAVNAPLTSAQGVAAVNAAVNGVASLRNPTEVALAVMQAMVRAAGEKGVLVNADTRAPDNSVDVRITFNPADATKTVNLAASTLNSLAANARATFTKNFSNTLSTVNLSQTGALGMNVKVAAKLNPALKAAQNLVFYVYDVTTNRYSKLTTTYRVDKNGYIHFTTNMGGTVIISAGALVKK